MIEICGLSSGSSGNCFYIGDNKNALLIDAGLSCKRVFERMNMRGLDIAKVRGIFISHEHTDHVQGTDVLARRLNVPVFATKGCLKNNFLCSNEKLINIIKDKDVVNLEDFDISVFSKKHDSSEPVSFEVSVDKKKIGILTDIGKMCQNTKQVIGNSDFLIMESNHNLNMLKNGPYPVFLKNRILGDRGHLSNFHAGVGVLEHADKRLKAVMLAHLSIVNNHPSLALSEFSNLIKERSDLNPKIMISSRTEPTKLFRL